MGWALAPVPLEGRGWGWGDVSVAHGPTPTPIPSPQGGGGRMVLGAAWCHAHRLIAPPQPVIPAKAGTQYTPASGFVHGRALTGYMAKHQLHRLLDPGFRRDDSCWRGGSEARNHSSRHPHTLRLLQHLRMGPGLRRGDNRGDGGVPAAPTRSGQLAGCGFGAGRQLMLPMPLGPYCTKPLAVGAECEAMIGR